MSWWTDFRDGLTGTIGIGKGSAADAGVRTGNVIKRIKLQPKQPVQAAVQAPVSTPVVVDAANKPATIFGIDANTVYMIAAALMAYKVLK